MSCIQALSSGFKFPFVYLALDQFGEHFGHMPHCFFSFYTTILRIIALVNIPLIHKCFLCLMFGAGLLGMIEKKERGDEEEILKF